MKAISKLISVVLILALCMSIFTVSAFAQEPVIVIGDTLDMTDGDPAEAVEDNSSDSLPGTIANAPADSSVKVATFKELEDALKAQNPAITLTAKVSVAGPLTLDYAVKLNLGGKGPC